jgi:hypothetical protein
MVAGKPQAGSLTDDRPPTTNNPRLLHQSQHQHKHQKE